MTDEKYPIDTVSEQYRYKETETETETEKETKKKEKDADRRKRHEIAFSAKSPVSGESASDGMNRRARRAAGLKSKKLDWGKVVPKGSYDELGDNDARSLLMMVFRAAAGETSAQVFDDRSLFDSTMTLIRQGLINIWFAIDDTDVQVKVELVMANGAAA